jgi:hypothetical protein
MLFYQSKFSMCSSALSEVLGLLWEARYISVQKTFDLVNSSYRSKVATGMFIGDEFPLESQLPDLVESGDSASLLRSRGVSASCSTFFADCVLRSLSNIMLLTRACCLSVICALSSAIRPSTTEILCRVKAGFFFGSLVRFTSVLR